MHVGLLGWAADLKPPMLRLSERQEARPLEVLSPEAQAGHQSPPTSELSQLLSQCPLPAAELQASCCQLTEPLVNRVRKYRSRGCPSQTLGFDVEVWMAPRPAEAVLSVGRQTAMRAISEVAPLETVLTLLAERWRLPRVLRVAGRHHGRRRAARDQRARVVGARVPQSCRDGEAACERAMRPILTRKSHASMQILQSPGRQTLREHNSRHGLKLPSCFYLSQCCCSLSYLCA